MEFRKQFSNSQLFSQNSSSSLRPFYKSFSPSGNTTFLEERRKGIYKQYHLTSQNKIRDTPGLIVELKTRCCKCMGS